MVRPDPPVPLLAVATARSAITPGGGVGVKVGVGVGVSVGVGVGAEVGVGVAATAGLSAISMVMLEFAPPLCVPWIVPVVPVGAKISWDISEVVDDLLPVRHTSVKPAGILTVVWTTIPMA